MPLATLETTRLWERASGFRTHYLRYIATRAARGAAVDPLPDRHSLRRRFLRPPDTEGGDLLMEVRSLDVEELGRAAHVPVRPLKDHLDVLALALGLERL